MSSTALGEILVAMGLLSPEDRDEAMTIQRLNGSNTFGEILVKHGYCGESDIDKAITIQKKLRSTKHHERTHALTDVALHSKEAVMHVQRQLAEIGRAFLEKAGGPEIPTPILGIPIVIPRE